MHMSYVSASLKHCTLSSSACDKKQHTKNKTFLRRGAPDADRIAVGKQNNDKRVPAAAWSNKQVEEGKERQ